MKAILFKAIACLLVGALITVSALADDLKIGAASVKVTPPIGTPMAGYYYERGAEKVHDDLYAKALVIEKNGVAAFSSNYNLYGDMSRRVMYTLRSLLGKENVEVYSVDEAFLDLGNEETDWQQMGVYIKETVEQWTGIKVSVGIAPTKVLAKVANHLAKKDKEKTNCVVVLEHKETIDAALQHTPVNEVWGIGRQYAKKLKELYAIFTAYDLSKKTTEWAHKNMGGVVGIRLVKELKGESVKDMEKELTAKKMIATTRMFGKPVKNIDDIKEAIATYTSKAAEKLRRQNSAANVISIFVVKKEQDHHIDFRHSESFSKHIRLPIATSSTHELIKPAVELVEKVFEKGKSYKKAGVMLSDLVPDETIQGNLFAEEKHNGKRLLMSTLDNVNFAMRDDMVKFAASGTKRNWKMRMEMRSPRYTTRWDELFEIN